jgi:GTP cyclohydrolase FolE2
MRLCMSCRRAEVSMEGMKCCPCALAAVEAWAAKQKGGKR